MNQPKEDIQQKSSGMGQDQNQARTSGKEKHAKSPTKKSVEFAETKTAIYKNHHRCAPMLPDGLNAHLRTQGVLVDVEMNTLSDKEKLKLQEDKLKEEELKNKKKKKKELKQQQQATSDPFEDHSTEQAAYDKKHYKSLDTSLTLSKSFE